eukprot:s125_g2.t4
MRQRGHHKVNPNDRLKAMGVHALNGRIDVQGATCNLVLSSVQLCSSATGFQKVDKEVNGHSRVWDSLCGKSKLNLMQGDTLPLHGQVQVL